MIPELPLWPALAVAGFGAILDARYRLLPNWLCAALAICGAGGLMLAEGTRAIPWALLHAALALIAGMLLFRFRIIGGGDAKFYAAAACAIPVGEALYFLGWTSAAGMVLLFAMVIGRRFLKSTRGTPSLRGWEVPYGIAIFAGFALTLAIS
jgi:prepilin peptidase CpaA